MNDAPLSESELAAFDPIGWYYAEQLALRASQASGPAQGLLRAKHQQALQAVQTRWQAAPERSQSAQPPATGLPSPSHSHSLSTSSISLPLPLSLPAPSPSPLAQLVHDMAPMAGQGPSAQPHARRAESPRLQAFRKQLGQISVQKQVNQALAQAPQNAGPINSHSLVLRALGFMRETSPDYLNRFMGYVETLLCLDAANTSPSAVKKKSTGSAAAAQPAKPPR